MAQLFAAFYSSVFSTCRTTTVSTIHNTLQPSKGFEQQTHHTWIFHKPVTQHTIPFYMHTGFFNGLISHPLWLLSLAFLFSQKFSTLFQLQLFVAYFVETNRKIVYGTRWICGHRRSVGGQGVLFHVEKWWFDDVS